VILSTILLKITLGIETALARTSLLQSTSQTLRADGGFPSPGTEKNRVKEAKAEEY
jgi:hypothetical protein